MPLGVPVSTHPPNPPKLCRGWSLMCAQLFQGSEPPKELLKERVATHMSCSTPATNSLVHTPDRGRYRAAPRCTDPGRERKAPAADVEKLDQGVTAGLADCSHHWPQLSCDISSSSSFKLPLGGTARFPLPGSPRHPHLILCVFRGCHPNERVNRCPAGLRAATLPSAMLCSPECPT